MSKGIAVMLACLLVAGLAGCSGGLGGPSALSRGEYTIWLMGTTGGQHIANSKELLESVRSHTGWKDVFLVHGDNHSDIYRGQYHSPTAAEGDLETARNFVAQATGMKPFQRARVVALVPKDVGPPEWNIQASKGYYTVLVADYYDVPKADYVGRQKFAVERCKELREQGYEAYYHHDPAHSYVMVGSFPKEAVRVIVDQARQRGNDPFRPTVFASQPMIQVLDPKMADIVAKVPFSVNGYKSVIRARDAQGREIKQDEPPRVVPVPGRKDARPTAGGRQ